MKKLTFVTSSERLARSLAEKYSVPIYLHAEPTMTDGKAIYLNNDYAMGEIMDYKIQQYFEGILDHEIAHLIFTYKKEHSRLEQDLLKTYNDSFMKLVINLLEDVRVNYRMSEKYLGSRTNIEFALEYFLSKEFIPYYFKGESDLKVSALYYIFSASHLKFVRKNMNMKKVY